jgi:tetratricopeptide (TPR) repeat protein
MLVVRKQGGRNLNNGRYVYLNVDDNPEPIKELRRLLDLNLGLLYTQKVGPLILAHKNREARDAAAQGAHYMPTADAYFSLGVMDYRLGEKAAALADLRKAIKLDPAVRRRLESTPNSVPPGAIFMGLAIYQDKGFLKQILGK